MIVAILGADEALYFQKIPRNLALSRMIVSH
jgi:hypothetical protein